MSEYNTKFSRPRNNIIALILTTIAATLLTVKAEASETAGMAMIILIWLPSILSLITLGAYFLTRMATKKWSWLATLIGCAINLFAALKYFFSG